MDDTDAVELRTALEQAGLAVTPAANDRESLLHELARRVDHLLRHNGEKLMYYLYSLDVSEAAVADAFATDRPAHAIAQAILDREAARLRTRKQYDSKSRSGVQPLHPREVPKESESKNRRLD